jgi:thioredoxin reductase (NADPH)
VQNGAGVRAFSCWLISWTDWSAAEPILQAAALAGIELCLPKPAWSPDEQFHRAVTESLEEWWRDQGGRYEAVTVIGEEPSARVHEIRDVLTRNNVPFGFRRAGSPEGRAALQQLGVGETAGPVVALYNGVVLVDPGNAEVAQALGTIHIETSLRRAACPGGDTKTSRAAHRVPRRY